MHRFLARAQPSFERLLLIESGPREAGEKALRYFYAAKHTAQIDVLTCYSTPPAAFDPARGALLSVHDREVVENRTRFIGKLARTPYTVVAILCTGSPILERWKWAIALKTSARLIAVNEEANYFTVDVWNIGSAKLMLQRRLDITQATFTALLQWLAAPFAIGYLALCTAVIHFRRWTRIRKEPAS
jgi:hypothetical protein